MSTDVTAPRIRWVIAAASFGFAVVQLDVTIVIVALPSVRAALHTTTSMLQWTVDGYTLSFAVLLLSAGVLSDHIGGRRAYILARGLQSERAVIVMGAALAVLAGSAFVRVEGRVAQPMLPLGFFRRPAFSNCIVFGVLMNLVYYGMLFVLTLYLQSVHGYSALQAGMAYLPLTATFILSNLVSQSLTARIGARAGMALGAAFAALGYALLARLTADSSYRDMLVAFAIIPLGMGVAIPVMTTTILGSVEQQWSGTVSGALNAARQAGGAIGVAIFGALVAGGSSAVLAGLHAAAWLSTGLAAIAAVTAWRGVQHEIRRT